jgi:tubulin monoglycylase TTLL15
MNQWVPPFYFGIFFAFLGVYILNSNLLNFYYQINDQQPEDGRIKILIISQQPNRFEIEKKVFDFLNFRQVQSFNSPWDILWINEYPLNNFEKLKNLKPHQRINHFPGLSQLTIKKQLTTKFHHHNFIPKGFKFSMKNELIDFVAKNPDKKFVVKATSNGGVKLIENINEGMSESFDSKEKFLQVFVHNPLLIDNKMFDIGVYVLITSFAPLRIYRFDKEILVRFCAKDYHPFEGG